MSEDTKAKYSFFDGTSDRTLEFDTFQEALLAATDDVLSNNAEPRAVWLPGETPLSAADIQEYAETRRNRGRRVGSGPS